MRRTCRRLTARSLCAVAAVLPAPPLDLGHPELTRAASGLTVPRPRVPTRAAAGVSGVECTRAVRYLRSQGDTILAVEDVEWRRDTLAAVLSLPQAHTLVRYRAVPLTRGGLGKGTLPVGWRLELTVLPSTGDGGGSSDTTRAVLTLQGGQAVYVVRGHRGEQRTVTVAPLDAVPGFTMAHGLLELLTRRFAIAGTQVSQVPVYFAGTDAWAPIATVRAVSRDSVALDLDRLRMRARVDRAGGILGAAIEPPEPDGLPIQVRVAPRRCTQLEAAGT